MLKCEINFVPLKTILTSQFSGSAFLDIVLMDLIRLVPSSPLNFNSVYIATNTVVKTVHTLKLPFKGEEGTNLIKSIKTTSRKALPENHDVGIVLTGIKLSLHFNIKDETNEQHKDNLVYLSSCPSSTCNDCYIGETGRRLSERVLNHSGKDTNSHFLRHIFTANHQTADIGHFQILNRGYNNNTYKRRVSEAPFVKQYGPTLNGQDNSVPLQVFNWF